VVPEFHQLKSVSCQVETFALADFDHGKGGHLVEGSPDSCFQVLGGSAMNPGPAARPISSVEKVVLFYNPVSGARSQALQLSLYSWIQNAVARGVWRCARSWRPARKLGVGNTAKSKEAT
jgi:hypothetical protein